MKPKIKYQQYVINVPSSGAVVPIEFETDKLYSKVTGINLVATSDKNVF